MPDILPDVTARSLASSKMQNCQWKLVKCGRRYVWGMG